MLYQECEEVNHVLNVREGRQASKRLVVEGQVHITRPERVEGIVDVEKRTREKRTKNRNNSTQTMPVVLSNASEDRNDVVVFDAIRIY